MKVFGEKHFLVGNFKAIVGVVVLLLLATTLFVLGKESKGIVLGLATHLTP